MIAPPLIVTKEEIDRGVATLDKHLAIADALVVGDAVPELELAMATGVTSDS